MIRNRISLLPLSFYFIFLQFLKANLKEYPDASKIHIVLDNVPAHWANKVERFESNVERLNLIKLHPYSHDLNPIETVWREVKKETVYNTFYRLFDEFKDSLTYHLRNFTGSKMKMKSICNLEKYIVMAS